MNGVSKPRYNRCSHKIFSKSSMLYELLLFHSVERTHNIKRYDTLFKCIALINTDSRQRWTSWCMTLCRMMHCMREINKRRRQNRNNRTLPAIDWIVWVTWTHVYLHTFVSISIHFSTTISYADRVSTIRWTTEKSVHFDWVCQNGRKERERRVWMQESLRRRKKKLCEIELSAMHCSYVCSLEYCIWRIPFGFGSQ